MPLVKKAERYVEVGYELCCGFERATALAADLTRVFASDQGFFSAKDDTRGWDGGRMALVKVVYRTLADANRLDEEVRRCLGRNVDFTYTARVSTGYSQRGGVMVVDASTTCSNREEPQRELQHTG